MTLCPTKGSPTPSLPTSANWTKSLRDSLELAELAMLRGMRWCAALDRKRESAGRIPSLTGSKDKRTLVAWKERSDTILILHKLCHTAASAGACHLCSAPSSN
jgi:hypothetical protein